MRNIPVSYLPSSVVNFPQIDDEIPLSLLLTVDDISVSQLEADQRGADERTNRHGSRSEGAAFHMRKRVLYPFRTGCGVLGILRSPGHELRSEKRVDSIAVPTLDCFDPVALKRLKQLLKAVRVGSRPVFFGNGLFRGVNLLSGRMKRKTQKQENKSSCEPHRFSVSR